MSGDPEQEYFSDGITEDIITDLSKVSALCGRVAQHRVHLQGQARRRSARSRAQLKVTHVLEGSVRKSGNRVRITAQLIEGATDSHLWAERYDRDLNDIFALQDEISEAIVDALKLKLLPAEKKAIEQRSTSNPEAYKLYPDGAALQRDWAIRGTATSRSGCASALSRSTQTTRGRGRCWRSARRTERLVNAAIGDTGWDAAERALALQPDLAEAHAAKGRILGDAGRYDEALVEHAHSAAPRSRWLRGECGGGALLPRHAPIRGCGALPGARRDGDRDRFLGARHGDPVLRGPWATMSARSPRRGAASNASRRSSSPSRITVSRSAGASTRWSTLARGRPRQGVDRARDAARARQPRTCATTSAAAWSSLARHRHGDRAARNVLGNGAATEPALVRRRQRLDPLRGDARFIAMIAKAKQRLAAAARDPTAPPAKP